MTGIVLLKYDKLTGAITAQECGDAEAYYMPKERALRALWTTGTAYVLAEDAADVQTDLRRGDSNATVSTASQFGYNCPYCNFTALNRRDYYQHLADVETRHVLTGAVKTDVPYRGMAAMAEARLQNKYAIALRREMEGQACHL